jgi:hypothetical protein
VGAVGQPAPLLTTGNPTLFESRGRANLKQASNKASIKAGPMGVYATLPKLTTQSSNKNGSVYLAKVSGNSTSKWNRSAVNSRATSLNSTSRIPSTSAGQFKGNLLQDGSAVKNGSRLVLGGSSLLTPSNNSSSVRSGSTASPVGSGNQLLEAVGAVSTSPTAAGPSTANTGSLNDPSAGSPPLGPPANTTWPPTPESPKILIFYIKFLNVNAPRNSLTIR